MVGGSRIPMLPRRPGGGVMNSALKELNERKAKGARRQSRRQTAQAGLGGGMSNALPPPLPLVRPQAMCVTSGPGPFGGSLPAPVGLPSRTPTVADLASRTPTVADLGAHSRTVPGPFALPSRSPTEVATQDALPSNGDTQDTSVRRDHAFEQSSGATRALDLNNVHSLADDILLMRDRTEKGILVGLDDDSLSDVSELTDLDELERRMTFTSSSTPDEHALSDTSELTDLDTLESLMGITHSSHWDGSHRPARKKRKWSEMTVEQHRSYAIMGLNRTAAKLVEDARSPGQTVVFSHFSLEETVETPCDKVAQGTFFFSGGDGPRRAVSADGYDLLYHFPLALRGGELEDLHRGAAKWASVAPITATSKHDFTDCYRDGEFMGQTQLCQFWHSPGHHKQNGMVARHIRQTGPSFRGAFSTMEEFSVVAAFCSTLLKKIDPLQNRLLWDVRQRRCARFSEQRMFKLYNPTLLWDCCEVVYNRWSPPHNDRGDPHYSWACIVYFGTFRSAWFEFPQLGLKLCLQPGDVVFFRGKDLIHAVPNWGDGERNFLIYFTHEATWANVGMAGQCASTKTHVPPGSNYCNFEVQ